MTIPLSELPHRGDAIALSFEYYGTAATGYNGGLVGYLSGASTLETSYASASRLNPGNYNPAYAGGLVGYVGSLATVEDSYARGDVWATSYIGGLVGYSAGTIERSYAATEIVVAYGSPAVGGAVGDSEGSSVSVYWDTEVSGEMTSAEGTGATTSQMQSQSTFVGWDFDSVWTIDGSTNDGYPFLRPAGEEPSTGSGRGSRSGGVMLGSRLAIELGLSKPTPLPAPSPVPSSIPDYVCTPSLFRGMTGVAVTGLQNVLKALGVFPSTVDATGFFGVLTESAVKAFQTSKGITPIGIVGPRTCGAINAL
jgi:hypothetical protein